jgi:hypothetical protein
MASVGIGIFTIVFSYKVSRLKYEGLDALS